MRPAPDTAPAAPTRADLTRQVEDLTARINTALAHADTVAAALARSSQRMTNQTLARDPDRPDADTLVRYAAFAAQAQTFASQLRRTLLGDREAAPSITVTKALENQLRAQVPNLTDTQYRHKARMLAAAAQSALPPAPGSLPLDREQLATVLLKAWKDLSDADVQVHRSAAGEQGASPWQEALEDADRIHAVLAAARLATDTV